jgi:hypothetical protein
MTQVLNYRFQFRYGTAAEWTATNEVLLPDEGGHESDTNKLKIGNGVTPWNALPYFGGNNASYPVVTTAGNITLNAADHANRMLLHTNGTITVGPSAAAGFFVGDSIKVRKQTTDVVLFAATGSATLDFNTVAYQAQMGKLKDVVELKVIAPDTYAILGTLLAVAPPTPLTLTGTYAAGSSGDAYTSSLAIAGGTAPYLNPRILSGALPPGLALSVVGSTLVLSGTPTAAASYTFDAAVDSTDGQTADSSQTIAVAGGSGGDPFWDYVTSLLHFEDGDGSTAFTDQKGVAWTIHSGTPKETTAWAQFGEGSLDVGGGSILGAVGAVGSGRFCIEGTTKLTGASRGIFDTILGNSASALALGFDGAGNIQLYHGGSVSNVAYAPAAGTPFAWCVERDGSSNIRVYADGVVLMTVVDSSTLGGSDHLFLGCYYNEGYPTVGYIDDFRVTIGQPSDRYGGPYTPATAAFPNHA